MSIVNDDPVCASNMVNAKEFLYATQLQGIAHTVQLNTDEMSKQSIWTARRTRAKLGYMLADKDGQCCVRNTDHTFPLTDRFLISTSGIVKCCSAPKPAPAGAPMKAQTLRPTQMYAYMRSHRYHPGGAMSVNNDLADVVVSDADCAKASIMFVGRDNGGAYSLDALVNHHCLGRIWRNTRQAMLMSGAYHPGGSKFHWEIKSEGAWRRLNK